jgi:indolepyruvate decarboxylase
MPTKKQITVAQYLVERLYEMGVRHLFSIPGDYIVPFLETIETDGRIQRIGNTNEMEAGYAADGYARLSGVGAVAVTYGVGAFSLLNTIAGAYVEKVPLVVINGSPSNAQRQQDRDTGLLWHHMMSDGETQDLRIYENVTAVAVRIDDPDRAGLNIDSALSTCLTEQRPVYLELFADMNIAPCAPPSGKLPRNALASDKAILNNAVAAAAEKIRAAKQPIIWGGVEIQRLGLQDEFEAFVKQTGIPFTTTLLGKSIVSEDNPLFAGVYDGLSSNDATSALFTSSDCLIALGAWITDINLLGVTGFGPTGGGEMGGVKPWGDDEINASRGAAHVGTAYFAQVGLGDFIKKLAVALRGRPARRVRIPKPAKRPAPKPSDALDFDNFFARMSTFIDDSKVVVCDISFSALGSMDIPITLRSGYVAQAAWASVGYAAPASMGVKYAMPDKRPVVFAGDGAFHMVCQTIATMVALEQNPVIFVMNNGIYGVEQWLVDATVYKPPGNKKGVTPINRLHRWEFSRLVEVFVGGHGYRVSTMRELNQALKEIERQPDQLALVDVRLPELSIPANGVWRTKIKPAKAALQPKRG